MKTITLYKDLKFKLKTINTPYGERIEPILYFKNEVIMNFNPDFKSNLEFFINKIKHDFKKFNYQKVMFNDIASYKLNIEPALVGITIHDQYNDKRSLTLIKFNDNLSSFSIL